MNKKAYKGKEFLLPGLIKSRYALNKVDKRFYSTIKISDVVENKNRDVAFLYRCIEHYKDKNPYMLSKHLRNLLIALERKIRVDHCA